MIEICKEKNKFKFYIDNVPLSKTNVIGEFLNNSEESSEQKVYFRIYINDLESSKKILPYKISEIANLKLISLQFGSGKNWKKLRINKNDNLSGKYNLSIDFVTKSKEREGFPFSIFCEEMEKAISLFNNENTETKAQFERARYRSINVSFNNTKLLSSIGNEFNKFVEIIDGLKQVVINELKKKRTEFKLSVFITSFKFPEELKISCEQYLLYFAQFLKDLGINTTSNLKEEAGKVLFSVTPTDDIEALDKIRESLAVYLNLPSSPIVYDDSFAAMRLQQQVENLQHSQRMATRELQFSEKLLAAQSDQLREKNITISQLQTNNEHLFKIVEKISSKSIMMDSLDNKARFEKVFDGLEFGESEELKKKLGIKFNPLASLKSLGRKLSGGDDEITSLNLNNETDENN